MLRRTKSPTAQKAKQILSKRYFLFHFVRVPFSQLLHCISAPPADTYKNSSGASLRIYGSTLCFSLVETWRNNHFCFLANV